MTKVLLLGNGVPQAIKTEATTWGQFKAQVTGKISFTDMKATDFVNKMEYSNDDSVLNFVDGVAKVFLIPSKGFKGGLGYAELKAALKELRIEAVSNEDEEVVTLIGNYTQCTTEELQRRYDAVNDLFDARNEVEEVAEYNSEELEELQAEVRTLTERVGAVELKLNMLNEHNVDLFAAQAKEFGANLK